MAQDYMERVIRFNEGDRVAYQVDAKKVKAIVISSSYNIPDMTPVCFDEPEHGIRNFFVRTNSLRLLDPIPIPF